MSVMSAVGVYECPENYECLFQAFVTVLGAPALLYVVSVSVYECSVSVHECYECVAGLCECAGCAGSALRLGPAVPDWLERRHHGNGLRRPAAAAAGEDTAGRRLQGAQEGEYREVRGVSAGRSGG